jgi:hypothetical protein
MANIIATAAAPPISLFLMFMVVSPSAVEAVSVVSIRPICSP